MKVTYLIDYPWRWFAGLLSGGEGGFWVCIRASDSGGFLVFCFPVTTYGSVIAFL